jgi:hypothetical protein
MKIAVWYHCLLKGPGINPDYAVALLQSQMNALRDSGLAKEASEIRVGINGSVSEVLLVSCFSPRSDTFFSCHPKGQSEIPTMQMLRCWLKPGWFVLYFHMKGVSHPNEKSYENWRQRMEQACVWNWKQCVGDLDRGFDAVGCHWLTPERFPGAVTSPFFGGTYWWSRSEYLMQLPPLPEDSYANRFEAESWIGRRRPYPLIKSYIDGWP